MARARGGYDKLWRTPLYGAASGQGHVKVPLGGQSDIRPRRLRHAMAEEGIVTQVLKGGTDLLGGEELIVDAMRDLLRDEVKRKMREELDKDPALQEELREAVRLYFEARVNQAYATLKFVKASAKLGVSMMPADLRADLGKEIGSLLEKEVAQLLEKAV